ncbi:PaaI family thioesterase [Arthrobacter sp. KK5.5]|uniref:PaaI family thioesterase n=1 Tax=Arthrobacter sp. KK5.5 TaxID=3373084 RepID=UPI003EE746FA
MEPATAIDVSTASKELRNKVETMHGLDFLKAVVAGELPESPLIEALGVRTAAASPGEVTLLTEPLPQHFNTIGTGHGGFLSTLLDTALGLAVDTLTPAGTIWTTTDLHVRFRRPMTSQSGTITAVGRVEHHGRSTAVSAGEVRDGEGRILATATASLFALRNPGDL